MLKKLSEKLKAKFPGTTPGCSGINAKGFLRSFLIASKPSRRSITAAKKKGKGEKGKAKKIPKIKKPKDLGHFLVQKRTFYKKFQESMG